MFFFLIFLIAMLFSYECARYEAHLRFQEYQRARYEAHLRFQEYQRARYQVLPNPVYHNEKKNKIK